MIQKSVLNRIRAYVRDPRPDFLPAFKMMLSPEFKMPIWEFVKYFANLLANKIPGLKQLVGNKRTVDFSEYMTAYDRTTATFRPYQEQLSRIIQLLQIKPGETVVELGSGTGNMTKLLLEQGASVIAIDNLRLANEVNQKKNPAVSVMGVNIDRTDHKTGFISLPDHSVDKICAANLWTYIRNRSVLYEEIKRLLKPGGVLVLAVERQGYDPLAILKEHLKKEYHRYEGEGLPPLSAAIKVYIGFIKKYDALLITMEETKKLMRGIAAGDYKVFTEEEAVRELAENGFKNASFEIAYAQQAIILKSVAAD